jgi:hypothetical protein
MSEMLYSAYAEECLSIKSVPEWHKIFSENHYKTVDKKIALEFIQECLAKDRTLSIQMLEEMTGIN